LYADFWKWAQAGKELVSLHLWDGEAERIEYGDERVEKTPISQKETFKPIDIYDLQRFTSLAGIDELSNGSLQNNTVISEGGVIWLDKPNAQGGSVYSIQYSRRASTEQHPTVFAIPIDSERVISRNGNTIIDSGTLNIPPSDNNGNNAKTTKYSGEFIGWLGKSIGEKIGELKIEKGKICPHLSPPFSLLLCL